MNRLRQLRKEKNLTLRQLSNEIEKNNERISITTISNLEREKRILPQRKLAVLAEYFGVSVNYLMGKSDKKNPSVLDKICESSDGYPKNNLYVERKRLGLTQENLGHILAENREYISEYELGLRPVPVKKWKNLEKSLHSEITYLLGINGKYSIHDMSGFKRSISDTELVEPTQTFLETLNRMYANSAFSVLYICIQIYKDYFDQENLLSVMEKIDPCLISMMESIIFDTLQMLFKGFGQGDNLEKEYFNKLFTIIEEYDFEKN